MSSLNNVFCISAIFDKFSEESDHHLHPGEVVGEPGVGPGEGEDLHHAQHVARVQQPQQLPAHHLHNHHHHYHSSVSSDLLADKRPNFTFTEHVKMPILHTTALC